MPTNVRTFAKNPHIYIPFLIGCILFVTAFFILYQQFGSVGEDIAFHKDVEGAIDVTGRVGELFMVCAAACLIFIMNFCISKRSYGRERFLSYMFSYVSIWVSVLVLMYVVSILYIN